MDGRSWVAHPFEPIYDLNSRVLILGTMPSPKSREAGFYYAHAQNRFWRVLAAVFGKEPPRTDSEKRELLLQNKLALWDVLKHCEITGASDASIKNAVPNDIAGLVKKCGIGAIFTNGKNACRFYEKLCFAGIGIKAAALPSTSPANCAVSERELIREYSVLRDHTEG